MVYETTARETFLKSPKKSTNFTLLTRPKSSHFQSFYKLF